MKRKKLLDNKVRLHHARKWPLGIIRKSWFRPIANATGYQKLSPNRLC